jgi:hypothetical protein
MPESKKGLELLEDWEDYKEKLFVSWVALDGFLQSLETFERTKYLKFREKYEVSVVSTINELAKLQDIDSQRQVMSGQGREIQAFVLQRLQYVEEWLRRSGHIEIFYDPEKVPMLIWGLIDQWNLRDTLRYP